MVFIAAYRIIIVVVASIQKKIKNKRCVFTMDAQQFFF